MNCKKKTPGNVNNREKARHKSGLLMCRHTCEDMSGFSVSTSAGCGGRSRASYRKSQKQERQKKGMKWICVINQRKKSPQNVSEVYVGLKKQTHGCYFRHEKTKFFVFQRCQGDMLKCCDEVFGPSGHKGHSADT